MQVAPTLEFLVQQTKDEVQKCGSLNMKISPRPTLKGIGTLVPVLCFPINMKRRVLFCHTFSPGHTGLLESQSNRTK